MTTHFVATAPAASTTYDDFTRLLEEPRCLAAFMGLSAVLVDREPLEAWLGTGYYATLVAGALQGSDFDARHPKADFGERLGAFLGASARYRDPSGVPLTHRGAALANGDLHAAVLVAGRRNHFEPLRRPRALAPRSGRPTEAVKRDLLRDDDGPGTAARSCLVLWYASGLLGLGDDAGGMGYMTKAAPIQTYSSGLVWESLISASAMGIAGPYYERWAYPPPRPILPPGR